MIWLLHLTELSLWLKLFISRETKNVLWAQCKSPTTLPLKIKWVHFIHLQNGNNLTITEKDDYNFDTWLNELRHIHLENYESCLLTELLKKKIVVMFSVRVCEIVVTFLLICSGLCVCCTAGGQTLASLLL